LVGDGDELLDCYRLARFYRVVPTVFLEMPLSEVRLHLEKTIELSHALAREQETDDG